MVLTNTKKWRFTVVSILCVMSFCFNGHARKVKLDTLYDVLTSGFFVPNIESTQVLKPGSINGKIAGRANIEPYCLYFVSFAPVQGVKVKASPFFHQECKAPNGVCQDLMECARESVNSSRSESLAKRWENFNIPDDKQKVSGRDLDGKKAFKHNGDECWGESTSETKVGAFQFYDGSEVAEQVCVNIYACTGSPARKSVACKPIEGTQAACPNVEDCLNEQIPLSQGYTEQQLSDLAPEKQKSVRASLAAPFGATTTAASNSGDAPAESTSTASIRRTSFSHSSATSASTRGIAPTTRHGSVRP